ncbi:MAG: zinc-dependent alcohol dehydrogenase family protein [Deltaproteobacteria bacterium]|nr:zinc-dependent alcohol dehydrogenase family protein [Deltaproteobacteria bacterium]MBW2632646.1 zinc-dependent alcohol dehydrogenase family protein [Deltaproteobacteria bacterium]
MKAAIYKTFKGPITIENLPDPVLPEDGVVLRVMANGICRSDWHGWMGHDADIRLPHVPGHEMAGIVEAVGKRVTRWKPGERVTLPFVEGCGGCPQCASGNHQVCDYQEQPGFTHWGSFAEYVALHRADVNLVRIPDEMEFVTAASLGCRFATSFRGIVDQGRTAPGEWVAIHGCGGVGLSALMIARAVGANTIGIDIQDDRLEFARSIGAMYTLNARETDDVAAAILDITKGGAHVSMDALGSPETCYNSVACLRKRGRHVQVGLMVADHKDAPIPMDKVIARELEILGSHGMQAYRYDRMLAMIVSGKLNPDLLIGKRVSLEASVDELQHMDRFEGSGVTIIDKF